MTVNLVDLLRLMRGGFEGDGGRRDVGVGGEGRRHRLEDEGAEKALAQGELLVLALQGSRLVLEEELR